MHAVPFYTIESKTHGIHPLKLLYCAFHSNCYPPEARTNRVNRACYARFFWNCWVFPEFRPANARVWQLRASLCRWWQGECHAASLRNIILHTWISKKYEKNTAKSISNGREHATNRLKTCILLSLPILLKGRDMMKSMPIHRLKATKSQPNA